MDQGDPASFNSAPPEELPAAFCPLCSARLQARHCKMLCPRCGFFLSCSEFE
jgi:hypothetical protein